MLGALADDRDHLGFVVELDRFLWPHDWLPMRHHRSQHTEENRRKFRDVVALRAFLHMVEVVEPKANDLPRMRYRQRVFQSIEGTARGCRRFLRKSADRREVAVAPAQDFGEIAWHIRIHRLQIDDTVTLDHAQPHAVIRFKSNDLHEPSTLPE